MPYGEAEGAARGRRIIPALRIARVKSRALNVETTLRLIGNRRQSYRGAGRLAAINVSRKVPIEPDAVDEAAGAVGDKELSVRGVEGDIAQPGAAVGMLAKNSMPVRPSIFQIEPAHR